MVRDLRTALAGYDLRSARPAVSTELSDRAADGWEPLLAIAEAAGMDWVERARRAALVIHGAGTSDNESDGIRLLADIRRLFVERGPERFATTELVEALCKDEDAPWGDYHGRPITTHRLARLLRPYGIRKRIGRPPVTSRVRFARRWPAVRAELEAGRCSRRQAARRLGIGTATLGRLLATETVESSDEDAP